MATRQDGFRHKNHKKKRGFNQLNSNQNKPHHHHSPNKKRKLHHNTSQNKNNTNTEDEMKDVLSLIKCNKPRSWTVSIALAGSVMNTAKTPQLQSYLASQLARVLSIFCIDEIIIFSETGKTIKEEPFKPDPNLFLFRLLQYLETPQYLRRLLFPVHKDFRYVGICRPLRTPHHLGRNELSPYREGIVLKRCIAHPKQPKRHQKPSSSKKKLPKIIQNIKQNQSDDNMVSLVSIGLNKPCVVQQQLEENMRVTVQIDNYKNYKDNEEYCFGNVVTPCTPMKKDGIYWGYKTRFAKDIGQVISSSTYDDGYDCVIGTSDKGRNVYDDEFCIPKFKHLLIVFGGPNGLESCVLNNGENGRRMKLNKPELLFDEYVNVCPFQGTRTIRSEEALLMTLSVLQPHFQGNYKS
eukprot:434883_1